MAISTKEAYFHLIDESLSNLTNSMYLEAGVYLKTLSKVPTNALHAGAILGVFFVFLVVGAFLLAVLFSGPRGAS
jgi:hypothetical protein